jgi:hypothetical protein
LILQSKLSKTAYPVADPAQYLTGDIDGLDPVFAGRLAYVAKVSNTKFKITDGFRSLEDQKKMYADYKAGKLQATAAVPGTSWHGSRLAVDTSSPPIRGMTNTQLAKYGLCKPLSKEGWHIQPIETAKMGAKCNMSLAPKEMEDDEVIEKGKYVIDGKEIEVDRILKDGKNFPELRDIAEALGYSVGYDAMKKLPVLAKK